MSRMSDLHVEMQEDAWSLSYNEFVAKWGEHYAYMYDEIRREEIGL